MLVCWRLKAENGLEHKNTRVRLPLGDSMVVLSLLMQPPNIPVPCETTRVKMGSDRHLGITVTAALTSKVLLWGESSTVARAGQRAEFTCH